MIDDDQIKQSLSHLAQGIQHVLGDVYGTEPRLLPFEYMFVLAMADGDNHVKLSTVTCIADPAKIYRIGQHIMEMAADMATRSDDDVQGHA